MEVPPFSRSHRVCNVPPAEERFLESDHILSVWLAGHHPYPRRVATLAIGHSVLSIMLSKSWWGHSRHVWGEQLVPEIDPKWSRIKHIWLLLGLLFKSILMVGNCCLDKAALSRGCGKLNYSLCGTLIRHINSNAKVNSCPMSPGVADVSWTYRCPTLQEPCLKFVKKYGSPSHAWLQS